MDSTILREYLVALGFKIDKAGSKNFDKTVNNTSNNVKVLGKGLVSVATAAQTMVAVFTVQMERLFYSSKKAEATASNLQAIEYGASRVGISADAMRGSMEGFARSIRSNPGLVGLLNSLGVEVKGRDKSDVFMDLVASLKKMPFHVAERYAGLFGIDADQLLLLQQGLDKMKEAAAARKAAAAEMGVDTDAAAQAGVEYANSWREIIMYVGLFKDALSIKLLPGMQEFANITKEVLKDWIGIVNSWKGGKDFFTRMWEGITGKATGGGVQLSPQAAARVTPNANPAGTVQGYAERVTKNLPTAGLSRGLRNNNPGNLNYAGQPGATKESGPGGRFAVFPTMEAGKNALRDQLLRYQTRGLDTIEKIINKYAPGSENDTGAYIKHMERATGRGARDKIDLNDATTMAKFMEGIMQHENGAAYNRYKLGAGSSGSSSAAASQINQTNNITVTGVQQPEKAAAEVVAQQRVVNADLVRNSTPRVR